VAGFFRAQYQYIPTDIDSQTGSISNTEFLQTYVEYSLFVSEGLNHTVSIGHDKAEYTVGTCDGLCVERPGEKYCNIPSGVPCALNRPGYESLWLLKRASLPDTLPFDLPLSINPKSPAPKGSDWDACLKGGNYNPLHEEDTSSFSLHENDLTKANPCRPSGSACYLTCTLITNSSRDSSQSTIP